MQRPKLRRCSLVVLGLLGAGCGKAHRESGAEILQRAEVRDAWLATAVPFAIALLLLVLLVIVRQRRKPTTTLPGLFRPHQLSEVQRWWRDRVAVVREYQVKRRERAAAQALEMSQPTAELVEVKPVPTISLAERLPMPEMNGVIRVQTHGAAYTGQLIDINEETLKLRHWRVADDHDVEIRWDQVRQISVGEGRGRQLAIPFGLAILGGGLLGACGRLMDELQHSTSGRYADQPLALWGILIGSSVAGGFGTIVMFALPGRRWRTLVDVGLGSGPLALSTVAVRAAETQATASTADPGWDTQDTIEVIARVLLALIVLGTCSVIGR